MTSTVMVRMTASSGWPTKAHTTAVTHADAEREPEQPARRAVGQPLGARRRVLRLGDQPLDAGERGVVTDRGDLDPQPGVGRDGAGDDAVARARGARAATRR